jgi:hypothetical protein
MPLAVGEVPLAVCDSATGMTGSASESLTRPHCSADNLNFKLKFNLKLMPAELQVQVGTASGAPVPVTLQCGAGLITPSPSQPEAGVTVPPIQLEVS